MLTARASRFRDWALFAAAAILPSIAVGILGLRAIENEAAGARREVSLEVATAAAELSRDLDREGERAAVALAGAALGRDSARIAEEIGRIAPPFADGVVIGPDRSLIAPAPASVPAAGDVPAACATLARSVASGGASGGSGARREFVARCAEARSDGGRWLWPVVALEAIRRGEGTGEAVPGWIEAHAGALSDAERAATSLEVRAALSGAARDRAIAALSIPWSRRDALAAEVRRAGAEEAMRAPPDRSGLLRWRAGTSAGTLRALDDGRMAGFVIYKAPLEGWIQRAPRAVAPGLRAVVIASAQPASAVEDPPSAIARIAPELAVQISPADPAAVARHAAFGRRLLGGIGAAAMAIAFGLGALLFARMRAERRLSALRTDFVAAVSHELRTPIASVRMLAELLEEGRLDAEEHREVFEALAREARRLGETVDRLLGFSRMAAGRQVLERSPGIVAAPVSASIDTFEDRNPDMPKVARDLDEGVRANIDPGQIRLAVDNLLVNARKYAPEGAPYRVRVRRDKGGAAISVIDAGPGIARRDQRRIFEAFERADDRLSRATEGSGIGLSLVRHVAEAHGGRAFVESDPGQGASFTIWIPLVEER